MGPYIDHEGRSMLGTYRGFQVLMSSSYFKGPGHNAVAQDDRGDFWILYHAFDTSDAPNFGNSPRRSLMIDLLIWNEQGWPYVQSTMPSNQEKVVPYITPRS
jgi:arabinan endo-1,5-alpha-L-arabinosidase